MSEKKCPCCGLLISENVSQCPRCGLEGVNRRFLSKAGYEKWVKEVLQPHLAAKGPRLFMGYETALILTAAGVLYGMGDNYCGQIDPEGDHRVDCHRMAENVISAAVSSYYTAYVTADGVVHIQGSGELADAPVELQKVREVWSDGKWDRFWFRTEDGQTFAIGDNRDGILAEKQEQLLYEGTETVVHGPFGQEGNYSRFPNDGDWYSARYDLGIQDRGYYKEWVNLYGKKNVTVHYEHRKRENLPRTGNEYQYRYRSNAWTLHSFTYGIRIVCTNEWIYKPIPVEASQEEPWYASRSDIRKAISLQKDGQGGFLAVGTDGGLLWEGPPDGELRSVKGPGAPVCDLALRGFGWCFDDRVVETDVMVVCGDNTIYYMDIRKLPEVEYIGPETLEER